MTMTKSMHSRKKDICDEFYISDLHICTEMFAGYSRFRTLLLLKMLLVIISNYIFLVKSVQEVIKI